MARSAADIAIARASVSDRRRRHVRAYDDEAQCRARLERDHRAVERIIARRKAHNALMTARAEHAAIDSELADELCLELSPEPVTMTALQFFLALAERYATDEQLAAFLYGRVTTKSLGAVRRARHALSKISDDNRARMGLLFARPSR